VLWIGKSFKIDDGIKGYACTFESTFLIFWRDIVGGDEKGRRDKWKDREDRETDKINVRLYQPEMINPTALLIVQSVSHFNVFVFSHFLYFFNEHPIIIYVNPF